MSWVFKSQSFETEGLRAADKTRKIHLLKASETERGKKNIYIYKQGVLSSEFSDLGHLTHVSESYLKASDFALNNFS